MPPEVSPCYPLVSPVTPLLTPVTPKSRLNRRMNVTTKKLIPILVFILIILSLLRLLKITISTSSSPAATCSSPTPACKKIAPRRRGPSTSQPLSSSSNASNLTEKELQFLSDIISRRAPCNLLVFGIELQYLVFSLVNAGGTTIFLEDNPDKLHIIKTSSNSTRVYKVEYNTPTKEAYKLLKHARNYPGCSPRSGLREASRCKLALTKLPKEVYKLKWDVVVVDGPSGDEPEAPGRMAAIYTASILARMGNVTDVVVHDVDRMIEKWFSWEFLCDDNLVSSKGKFCNYRITQQSNSTTFCPT